MSREILAVVFFFHFIILNMSCHSLWLAEFLLKGQLLTLWGFPCVLFVAFPLLLLICIYLFIYGCVGSLFLCEGFLLVVASGCHSSSWCAGLSLSQPLLLQSKGSRRTGSVIVAHRLICSMACGIFPDQGSNPCPLHWQAGSQPLCHQGSPLLLLLTFFLCI